MADQVKRYLFFGAHPDDAEEVMGGTAVKLARAGHVVKFVSMCNGDCGHFDKKYAGEEGGKLLAARRKKEAERSAAIGGISEYEILDCHDCRIQPDLATREKVVRIIRKFCPHVVITHRDCDYHADHRATAQLVQDAAYLTQVPKFCPETPIPEMNPVFGCVWDTYNDPRPFRPDAAVAIDDVMEEKCRLLNCQVSQFYEWLAWGRKLQVDPAAMSWEEKLAYLMANWGVRSEMAANGARQTLIEIYGEAGKNIRYAESFELSPYGRKITVSEFRELLKP